MRRRRNHSDSPDAHGGAARAKERQAWQEMLAGRSCARILKGSMHFLHGDILTKDNLAAIYFIV
jgi:hypothetical protein